MELNSYLLIGFCFALLFILYLILKMHRVREQLAFIEEALADLKDGNLNRRVLARKSDMTRQICYDINEIAINSQSRLIQQKQAEQAYKHLMTSLSHDVKTPLASLVGYLEAIESGLVLGQEKDDYLHVAVQKAYHLKDFVTALFEWVKLDAGEQLFHLERMDLNELSRNILTEWIPLLENAKIDYEITIPDNECFVQVDPNAYTRILNNLLQNILIHSQASRVEFSIAENAQQTKIMVSDNGKGISVNDLPHIFERLYRGDKSRSTKPNQFCLRVILCRIRGTFDYLMYPYYPAYTG